jgi:AraC-like DNA-binding protein
MTTQNDGRSIQMETVIRKKGGWIHPALRRAMQYVASHIGAATSLEEIAAAAGVSKSHFCALSQQTFGMGFKQAVRLYQSARAKECFDTTDRTVTDVCRDAAVGFRNVRQLRRAFWKFYGCSPSHYRRSSVGNQRVRRWIEGEHRASGSIVGCFFSVDRLFKKWLKMVRAAACDLNEGSGGCWACDGSFNAHRSIEQIVKNDEGGSLEPWPLGTDERRTMNSVGMVFHSSVIIQKASPLDAKEKSHELVRSW